MRPEDYWIGLGENVIGLDVLREGDKARQAATYQAIVGIIMGQGIRQILDLGCNVCALGVFLRYAHFKGTYVGIDSNPFALMKAINGYGFTCILENIRQLSCPDQGFTCVIVKDVIEHLESIEPLREAFRVSDKYVIIATYLPWHDAPSVIQQHPDGYYTNTYNRAEILALGRGCGFECAETLHVNESNGTPNEITTWERVK